MSVAYKIRYARHALSLSNAKDNSGVDLFDPPLTTREDEESMSLIGKLDDGKRGGGEDYALGDMRRKFENFASLRNQSKVFVVSPLTRVVQTFLLAVPDSTLKGARIVVEPLLVEQTRWFSDRSSSVREIQAIMRGALERKNRGQEEPLVIGDLNIDWSKMLQPRDEQGEFCGSQETMDQESTDKGWHLKNNFWAPSHLIDRGLRATREVIQICREVKREAGNYDDYAVCVFGHGGFVNYMVEEVGAVDLTVEPKKLSAWSVGEIRDYEIEDIVPLAAPQGKLFTQPSRRKLYDLTIEAKARAGLMEAIVEKDTRDQYGEQHKSVASLYKATDITGKNPNPNMEDDSGNKLGELSVVEYREQLKIESEKKRKGL
ncbi:hypothetical protein TruAng_002816 [Truncatella angustata]|nr:hypothetical protein TruAng_002816 [Truncatella angustata]